MFNKHRDIPETWDNTSESQKAESYMRSASHGIKDHYTVQGVQDILQGRIGNRGKIADISDSEVERIQQKLSRGR
jgi:hypothetical protein